MFDLLDAPSEPSALALVLPCAQAVAKPLASSSASASARPADQLSALLHQRPQWFWRASDLAGASSNHLGAATTANTGHCPSPWPELNAQLPGGGWPTRCVVDVLQTQAGTLEWRLLGASLAQHLARHSGQVLLVNPPLIPYAPGLAALGIEAHRLIGVGVPQLHRPGDANPQAPAHTPAHPSPALTPRQALWATEQALQCPGLAAVLAWLPQAQATHLRRLHSRALGFEGLCFVMRPASAQHQACAAPLRVLAQLQQTRQEARQGTQQEPRQGAQAAAQALHQAGIELRILKRRGPPLDHSLVLPAWPTALAFGAKPPAKLQQKPQHLEAAPSTPPSRPPPKHSSQPPTQAPQKQLLTPSFAPQALAQHTSPLRRAVRGSRRAPFADTAADLTAGFSARTAVASAPPSTLPSTPPLGS